MENDLIKTYERNQYGGKEAAVLLIGSAVVSFDRFRGCRNDYKTLIETQFQLLFIQFFLVVTYLYWLNSFTLLVGILCV